MEIEQRHISKLLAAYRNGFAVRGQVATTIHTMNDLCAEGLLEARVHQPDRRRAAETRYYLTAKGSEYIKPIAERQKAVVDSQERERAAKERLEAAAPDMLAALKGVVAAWVNPHDGGEYESGEIPALDAARAAIVKATDPSGGEGPEK